MDQFSEGNEDLEYLRYNILNSIYLMQNQVGGFIVEELVFWAEKKFGVFNNILIISICWVVVGLLIITPFFFRLEKSEREVLLLFLEIPNRKARICLAKCEKFLSFFQNGNDDNGDSDQSFILDHEVDF